MSIKGDYIFNEKHRISGYYGWDRETQNCGADGCPGLPGNNAVYRSDVLRFQWDWAFGPNKLNHFQAGGNNWREDHQPPQ